MRRHAFLKTTAATTAAAALPSRFAIAQSGSRRITGS